jgi:hypothetical protein
MIAFFFLDIIKDKDTFSSYSARIEALFIIFLALTFSPVRVADRFSAVFSISAKSLT